jgi:hypothetical protein
MTNNEIILYCLIIVVLIIYYNYYISNTNEYFTNLTKYKSNPKSNKFIWTYWENKSGRTESFAHIKLCFKTMEKHLGKYNLVILDEKTIHNYLPNLRPDLSNYLIAQKVDYYRVALLVRYGGIWIDADTIVMKDLDDIFNKLNKYDFLGFGCTGDICFNGYPDPSNGVMASRKNGILMRCVLNKLNKMFDLKSKDKTNKFDYFEFGKKIIWDCLDNLLNTNYKYLYYHYTSEYDGSRDNKGKWLHTPEHFSKNNIILLDENKTFFVFLANYEIMHYPENKWILTLSESDILNGPWWISNMYRKALN